MTAPFKQLGEADWYQSDLPPILRPRRPRPLRAMAIAFLVVFSGALLGIASAYLVIERERPLVAVTIGPWETYPGAGTADADPYSVAIYTRGAKIPLASGEGLELIARKDSTGSFLSPTCRYKISGQTPTARLWTLTATDGTGKLTSDMVGNMATMTQMMKDATGIDLQAIVNATAQGNAAGSAMAKQGQSGPVLVDAPASE